MTMERRLGKGLAQILETSTQPGDSLVMLRVEQIRACRYQPRQDIDMTTLEELKASIKRRGVIQPVVVRPIAHGIYELVAGERRWRAVQQLGLAEIPAIIKTLTDQETLESSIIENVQREGLNPVDEAKAFARLISEFKYTQEQLAEAVSKDRSSVANVLRLLKLPEEIQLALRDGKITSGHAKALLSIEPVAKQLELFRQTTAQHLSVRQLEEQTARWQPKQPRRRRALDPHTKALEEELRQLLGTKVSVLARKKGGRVIIEYFSTEDFTRILQALGVGQKS